MKLSLVAAVCWSVTLVSGMMKKVPGWTVPDEVQRHFGDKGVGLLKRILSAQKVDYSKVSSSLKEYALQVAAGYGRASVVKYLWEERGVRASGIRRFPLSAEDKFQATGPLSAAVYGNQKEILEYLCGKKDNSVQDEQEALNLAFQLGHLDLAELLIGHFGVRDVSLFETVFRSELPMAAMLDAVTKWLQPFQTSRAKLRAMEPLARAALAANNEAVVSFLFKDLGCTPSAIGQAEFTLALRNKAWDALSVLRYEGYLELLFEVHVSPALDRPLPVEETEELIALYRELQDYLAAH